MSDLIIAIFVTLAIWTATAYEFETQQQMAMYEENMSEVWVASMKLTDDLKKCEKRKRR